MLNVAFLRGINVGGRAIHMADLRACFGDLGFDDVTTVLQTGNVIFSSDDSLARLKRTIEAGLSQRFGYSAHVQVVRMATLRQILHSSPFDGRDPQRHSYVVFFENGLEKELIAEAKDLDNNIDGVEVGDVIYWRVPKGSTLQSGFARYLTKVRYREVHTNRNISTLRKIVGDKPPS
jgi:uncharacterized protein (DUF1697 family)